MTSTADIQPSKFKAALWMAGWMSAMLMLLVAGRRTASELQLFQVLEIRTIIGLILLSPLVIMNGGFASLATSRPLTHLGRAVAQYGAQYFWFLGLTLIPLTQVVSIEFTMPIWTAILAMTLLGEKMTTRRALSIVLGLAGVAIIVRPEFSGANIGQVAMLVAAVAISISVTLTKSLTRTDHVVTITFWMLFAQSVIGLIPACYVWTSPRAELWPWLVVVAFCGMYSQYCLSQAMRYAEATTIVSMDFLRVPLSALLGWVMFAEHLDVFTFLGAAAILAGNLLNLRKAPVMFSRKN